MISPTRYIRMLSDVSPMLLEGSILVMYSLKALRRVLSKDSHLVTLLTRRAPISTSPGFVWNNETFQTFLRLDGPQSRYPNGSHAKEVWME